MNFNLKDKNFIVSGSSGGIGLGIANSLLKEGSRVFITGLSSEKLLKTFNDLKLVYNDNVLCNYGNLNNVKTLNEIEIKILNKWKKIDGIVANAGAVKPVSDWNINKEDWNWYFENNFYSAVSFITKFIPHIIKTNGSIVVTGSIAGIEEVGAPIPYSVSKAALHTYVKSLSKKLAQYKVRVNIVSPGNIIFKNGNWEKKLKDNPENIQKILNEKVPLNKFGTPEDIGNLTSFLLSNKSSFITGSSFVVDGGQTNKFS